MPRGSRTKATNALSSGVSRASLARGWFQSNQRIHQDLETSGSEITDKLPMSDSEGYAEHLRVMMQTRVAVRDKTPHRFQIVPLREVTNLGLDQTEVSTRLNIPTTPLHKLHHSPSGKLGPYSQTRTVSPARYLKSEAGGDIPKPVDRQEGHLNSPQEPLAAKLDMTPRHADHARSRRVLSELDLNMQVSMAAVPLKPIASQSVAMRSVPSRDLLTSFSHTTQTTPRASTGQSHQDEEHPTLTAHISQISQLFSSDNVAPLPPMRRNRSMTVSSVRSDTSVGMSDTSQETEAQLKRRHAIYRESSCMPYLGKSQDKTFVAPDFSIPVLGTLAKNVTKRTNFDQHTYSVETSRPLLQPPFELKQKNVSPLVIRPRTPHLQNSGAPTQPLKLSKNKHVSRRTTAKTRETVYPRIVLELFRDIDEAIAQWTRP